MFATMHRRLALLRNLLLGSVLLAALEVAVAAITVSEDTTPTLGTLLGGLGGRNFILNTDETVSGFDSIDYLFGAVTGQLGIKGENATVNIVADNFMQTGGVTIMAVPCRFHTGSQTLCNGSGINVAIKKNQTRILYVGVNLDTTQMHSGGDSPTASYDITVTLL